MLERTDQVYGGRRILEAMHSAVRYSDAMFTDLAAAMPAGTTRILDFGAGDGTFVDRFRARGVAVECLEPDPELHEALQPRAARVYRRIGEIADSTFDFVYTINVLEHISEIEDTCAELNRITRPGGTLFVFVPAHEILWTSLDSEVGHVRRFSRSMLRTTLENAGFVIEDLRFFDSLGFAAALGVRVSQKLGLFQYDPGSVRLYDRYLFPLSRRLDRLLSGVVGKNLMAVANKPVSQS
jgi:SAM-dependent methyltransferase